MKNKISILILGFSRIVIKRVLPALNQIKIIDNISIASKSKEIVLTQKVKNSYSDYDLALSKFKGNFVYISLTNDLHDEYAIKCIKYNFNIIIDKPAFLKIETIDLIKNIQKINNVKIFESSVFSYHPIWDSIKKLHRKINTKTIISIFNIPKLSENDFRLSSVKGGGAINDMNAYSLGFFNLLFDEEIKKINLLNITQNNGLVESFDFHLKSRNNTNFYGFYGFGLEYEHSVKFIGSNGTFEVKRLFSLPSDLESEIILKENNELKSFKIKASDTFKNFFELIFNDFVQNNESNLILWETKMLQNFNNLQLITSKI
jgi:dTDP-3,4-didehydro-2,6-dideoxy-alpha-D-glucose 3-reductase